MTKFVETLAGTFVSASEISRIISGKSKSGLSSLIRTRDDSGSSVEFETLSSAQEIADWLNSTIIPAQPGYFLVHKIVGGATIEQFTRWATPIIAWRFEAYGYPTPMTVEGPWNGEGECHLIIDPNGVVTYPGNGSFTTIEEAYEAMKSDEEGRKSTP